MANTKRTRAAKLERRRLEDLVPFPLQRQFFSDLPGPDLQALALDIATRGLRTPIEILPRNKAGFPPDSILAGHQRRRALELNGETETEVLVRHDLAGASKAEIEKEFLQDNANRRQMDKLERARVALRMMELEQGQKRGDLLASDTPEARDRVGQVLGVSGRMLSRYLRVLRCPQEIQRAYSNGQLPLNAAERVADLPAAQQNKLARRLQRGEAPRAVLARHLPAARRPPQGLDTLPAFLNTLVPNFRTLEAGWPELPAASRRHYEKVLAKVAQAIGRLLGQAVEPRPRRRGREEEE